MTGHFVCMYLVRIVGGVALRNIETPDTYLAHRYFAWNLQSSVYPHVYVLECLDLNCTHCLYRKVNSQIKGKLWFHTCQSSQNCVLCHNKTWSLFGYWLCNTNCVPQIKHFNNNNTIYLVALHFLESVGGGFLCVHYHALHCTALQRGQ